MSDDDIYVRILAEGKTVLKRDLYLNSGSLNRILKNHPSPTQHLPRNVVAHLEKHVEAGRLAKHTFVRERNYHYYSLPDVGRPDEEPGKGVNLI